MSPASKSGRNSFAKPDPPASGDPLLFVSLQRRFGAVTSGHKSRCALASRPMRSRAVRGTAIAWELGEDCHGNGTIHKDHRGGSSLPGRLLHGKKPAGL